MQGPRPLLWGLLCFVLGQALVLGAVEWHWPFLRDLEFDRKLSACRARQAERPGRPLIALMGSSRTAMGFRPDLLAVNGDSDPDAPLVFNFGCCNSTPFTQLLTLHRLLDQGVRPSAVVLEVYSVFLSNNRAELDSMIVPDRLNYRDVCLLEPLAADPTRLWRSWRERQRVPCVGNRSYLLARLAPRLHQWAPHEADTWSGVDEWGWLDQPYLAEHSPLRLEVTAQGFCEATAGWFRSFEVQEAPAEALEEILALCRREEIAVLLLLLPEPDPCRRHCYPPANEARLNAYLNHLRRSAGVPVIDGRDWLADTAFGDAAHLTHDGAAQLHRRFERELLPRLAWQEGSCCVVSPGDVP